MRPRFIPFILAFVAASAASCALLDRPMPPAPIPARGTVDRVVVTLPSEDSFHPDQVEITDPAQVEQLLAFLAARNSGWYGTWHTGAASNLIVSLRRGGDTVMVVDIGGIWISALACGSGNTDPTRYRDLSEKDRAELLAILGLPADTPSNR